jgi:heme b synthase
MKDKLQKINLRLIAFEVTRRCNLSCMHCRARAINEFDKEELSTEECFLLIDEIAKVGNPTFILTGGEPLLRQDIFKIASYGMAKGFTVVMAPNGTLINKEIAKQIKDSGIKRISISLDGANAKTHDEIRQVPGAFESALKGIKYAKKAGIEFQINATISKQNYTQIDKIINLSVKLGAVACHLFFIVPTGRAKGMKGEELDGIEYERVLKHIYEESKNAPINIRVICAPHYFRIIQQGKAEALHSNIETHSLEYKPLGLSKGCLAGTSFCFVSYKGEVFPCGYLEVSCGNIRKQSFKEIWENSQVFINLRDFSKYKGKCGRCEYLNICGGCRARAYAKIHDYLSEEPNCMYKPQKEKGRKKKI